MNINNILIQLASDPSRLAKEDILKANKDNELLKRVFKMALDPYLNYFIKIIPHYDPASHIFNSFTLPEALDELEKLTRRVYTGHAGINHLVSTLSAVSSDDAEVIVKIIRRDLRCGVNVATVNKIWENLIPTYPCLLCSPYDEKTIKKIKWDAYCQKKEDGARFNAIVENNACTFYSRKGSLIEVNDPHFYDEFIRLANGRNIVFDGELLAFRDGLLLPRKESNGIANKAIKGTITKEESTLLCSVLWDVIPLEHFKQGESDVKYVDRFTLLSNLIEVAYHPEEQIISGLKANIVQRINLVPTRIVKNMEQAQEIFQQYLADGAEGVILKNIDSLWSDTRSKEQIKLKSEKVCELRVIDWNYGAVGTKNEHRLGSLLCSSEDGKVVVNISGFSDEERDTITKENSVDKIVSVMYNERITKKNSNIDSLFLPRIVEFRADKDVADNSEDIK